MLERFVRLRLAQPQKMQIRRPVGAGVFQLLSRNRATRPAGQRRLPSSMPVTPVRTTVLKHHVSTIALPESLRFSMNNVCWPSRHKHTRPVTGRRRIDASRRLQRDVSQQQSPHAEVTDGTNTIAIGERAALFTQTPWVPRSTSAPRELPRRDEKPYRIEDAPTQTLAHTDIDTINDPNADPEDFCRTRGGNCLFADGWFARYERIVWLYYALARATAAKPSTLTIIEIHCHARRAESPVGRTVL